MKIIGFVPARMASSRLPGKPLHSICGMPMVEHVFRRAAMYPNWDGLYLTTCDDEIAALGKERDWPVLMTSDKHTRALERVAEAADKCEQALDKNDIILCVQGDEPMLHPDMIAECIRPLEEDSQVPCTMLAVEIDSDSQYRNKDILKIVHNIKGDVLYTSRSPVPHCESFSSKLGIRRVSGIFAFRLHFLKTFERLPESPLEIIESCDSNRIMDHGYFPRIAPYTASHFFSVDSPSDIALVEEHMKNDPLWGKY